MDEATLDIFLTRLQKYNLKSAYWIYPGEIKRVTNIDIRLIYTALLEMEKNRIVRSYIEVYCPCCGKNTGHIYESLSDLEPDEIICSNCGSDVTVIDHHAIIFKLIME